MAKLMVREEYVNATKGHRFGDSGGESEAFTEDRGELYRALVREYGRCTGKVYVDRKVAVNGDPAHGFTYEPLPIGWVFLKRMDYEDAHRIPAGRERTYLREVWVMVREVADDDEEN